MRIDDDIINIKGLGEKSRPLYSHIGIETVDDLIHYFPRDYIKYEELTEVLGEAKNICAFKATVISQPLVRKIRRLQITTVKLNASGTLVTATWFHMPFLSKMLAKNKEFVFRGKLTCEGDHFHIEQPAVFTVEKYNELEGNIAPVYSLTKGLTNNAITKSVKNAFEAVSENDYDEVLYTMHFPEDRQALEKSRAKLVFDEFLLFILRLRFLKDSNSKAFNDFNIIETAYPQRVIENLPYKLTGAQTRVWNEIKNDICSNRSMSRLVQGDVGCGKTILALLSCVLTASNGYQSAVMAPTEILATQHFEFFRDVIKKNDFDFEVILLTGSVTEANKKKIRAKIESGEAKIIIGTHALIQEKVVYDNLALVVTDEQHRFGVNQREILTQKSNMGTPHVLVMSATPIPRTLAIIMYGDLSISVCDELPSHKLPIKSAVVGEGYRKKAYDFMLKEIRAGHQVYVICPLVEESEGMDAKDVVRTAEELLAVFPEDVIVAKLHGKMKAKEKQKVMDDFAANNINILVSTTVVEVGVNVPNATVMLVENADRFGLAQLHQLRGRIGRGQAQSFCVFMSGSTNEKTLERLEILRKYNDGFKIASEDLKSRGPGDFFGIRQSGEMQFKLADVFTDASIMQEASEEADRILADDPNLMKEEHSKLKQMLEKSFTLDDIGKTL